MVGLFEFKVFSDETQTRQYFQCRNDSEPPMIFRQSSCPDGIAISHKALYRSIIDCTWSLPFLNLMAVSVESSKETLRYFSMGRPSGCKCNHVRQNQKTEIFISHSLDRWYCLTHLRVPFVLYHNHSIDRVITHHEPRWDYYHISCWFEWVQSPIWAMSKRYWAEILTDSIKNMASFCGLNQGFGGVANTIEKFGIVAAGVIGGGIW